MAENIQKPEPKISLTEALLIGMVLVIISILNLIPFVGDITSFIGGSLMFFYLYQKGLLGASVMIANTVGYICGFIPLLQEFPTELAAWIVTVIIDQFPKLEAIAERLGEIEELGEGGVGEAGAAEGAVASEASVTAEASAAGEAGEAGAAATPEAGSEAKTGASRADGEGNAKPTERSTERGTEAEEEKKREQSERKPGEESVTEVEGGGAGGETREERRKREKGEDYEKLMETGAETPPMEQAEKEDFAERKPIPAGSRDSEEEPAKKSAPQESEATRRLSKRFAELQKKNQQRENLAQPQVSEGPDKEDQKEDDDRAQAA